MYKIMLLSVLVGSLIFWRVILPLKGVKKWIALMPLVLAAFKFPIIRLLGGPDLFAPIIPGWVILAGGWLYGAMVIYFVFLAVYEFFKGAFFKKTAPEKRRRYDACCHLALFIFTLIIVTVGVYNTIPVPRVTDYEVKINKLSSHTSGLRIAVLADLHADRFTGNKRISAMVDRVMEQKPDMIVIVGDFVDGRVSQIKDSVLPLNRLKAPYGVFGVAGNHEYYSRYLPWKEVFESLGIKMLDNENVVLPCSIAVAGVTDRAAKSYELPVPDVKKALQGIPENMPVILLAHRPDVALQAEKYQVALQISGHTHGGMAPILSYLVKRANKGFVSGRYKIKDTELIISNGSGIWNGFPVRIGVPAEIVVITLR